MRMIKQNSASQLASLHRPLVDFDGPKFRQFFIASPFPIPHFPMRVGSRRVGRITEEFNHHINCSLSLIKTYEIGWRFMKSKILGGTIDDRNAQVNNWLSGFIINAASGI